MAQTVIRARPTTYNGIRMRSRLEADYAAHLDATGYRWEYEPECFASASGQWLPDFGSTFADEGPLAIYTEIKPSGPLLAARAAAPLGHIGYADQFLGRISVAWASRPDAQLELVFWEYGAQNAYLHLFSQGLGRPWLAWNSGGTVLAWIGMGQLARLCDTPEGRVQ